MRAAALAAAALDDRSLATLDVGAGTGFTTEGIVERVDPRNVTMLDQSPHQLARARAKPHLAHCAKLVGDAEALPFQADSFDRYVSAGSIEYWPDPQRGIAEAWMLFPTVQQYRDWLGAAGFTDVRVLTLAPPWYRSRRAPYAVAVTGTKARPGPPALPPSAPSETVRGRIGLRPVLRFAAGSLVGALFVPLAAALALRHRLEERRSR